jgi:aminoglycoside 6-adenylyltransferase
MRTEQEMMALIMDFVSEDDRIRVAGMNGSRVNKNAPEDDFRDYDIACVVTDLASFIKDETWLERFGRRIIMQKPEAMRSFPPALGNWFSYLVLFEDGNRIDFMLIPLEELDMYLKDDSLTTILLDKDKRVPPMPAPSDASHHVSVPDEPSFSDCFNEFWWVSTYVAKGLCRGELLYAAEHMDVIVRPQLLRMLSWKAGIENAFGISVGKSYKYLPRYIPDAVCGPLFSTYDNGTYKACWDSLFTLRRLFRDASRFVADKLGFEYPSYGSSVSAYIDKLYKSCPAF